MRVVAAPDKFRGTATAAEVAAATPRIELQTRDLGGYGLAILETGAGDHRRALSIYYGDASGGHGHYDRLNVEMFAYGHVVMSEDGYPTPFTRPSFHEWRRADTHKHYCVMVDELPQLNLYRGDLHSLVSLPELQMVDASAEVAYDGIASLYRRTSSLIDISPERSYLLDIFRVRGGRQHDWCFHGPGFPQFQFTGGDPGPVPEDLRLTVDGDRVLVHHAVDGVVAVLQDHPLGQRPQVVTEVERVGGGLHAGEDPRAGGTTRVCSPAVGRRRRRGARPGSCGRAPRPSCPRPPRGRRGR